MSLKKFLSFAVIGVFIGFVAPKEFCDSFKENDYKINYGFRRVDRRDNSSGLYIFIGHHYWELSLKEGQLDFMSKESKESDWFGDHYSLAFELGYSQSPAIGLLNDYMDLVEFRSEIEGNKDLIGFHGLEISKVSFEDFRPTLVIQTHKWLQTDGWIAFINQTESHIQWKYCYFHPNQTLGSCSSEPSANKLKELDVIKNISNSSSDQMIAVFPLKTEDFIVLFKKDNTIQWCSALNSNNSYESNCMTKERDILIDCDHGVLLIVLIVVVIIVLLIIIPLVLWALYSKLNINFGTNKEEDQRRREESSGTVLMSKISEPNKVNHIEIKPKNNSKDSIDSNKAFGEKKPDLKPGHKSNENQKPAVSPKNIQTRSFDTIDSNKPFEDKSEKTGGKKPELKPIKETNKPNEGNKPAPPLPKPAVTPKIVKQDPKTNRSKD